MIDMTDLTTMVIEKIGKTGIIIKQLLIELIHIG